MFAAFLQFNKMFVKLILGRDRQTANLGSFVDFPTNVADGSENFELNIEKIKITENVKAFVFRGPGGS
jgi:hypothetical protein